MPRLRKASLVALLARTLDLPYEQAYALVGQTVPVMDVTSVSPEDWSVVGQRLGAGGHLVAAAVGFRSTVGVENKTTAQRPGIVVLTDVWLAAGAVGFGSMRITASPGVIVGTQPAVCRDSTIPGFGAALAMPIGQIRFDNTQLVGAYGGILISDGLVLPSPGQAPLCRSAAHVIAPGLCLFFMPQADNLSIAGDFAWREYELQLSVS